MANLPLSAGWPLPNAVPVSLKARWRQPTAVIEAGARKLPWGRTLPNAVPASLKARWRQPTAVIEAGARNLPWGRLLKFGAGAALLAVGALTTYQQIVVRVSREAVMN